MNIKHIKQQLAINYQSLPDHWVTDWLLYVIDKPNSFLITDVDYKLTDSEQLKFNDGIVQMQAGKPLAYLTGKQAFWSLDFMVNEYTLIPRPDTEVLVETVLNWINNEEWQQETTFDLLDLGTGSGCIAISLAHELANTNNHWQVTAVDLSNKALEVAKQNAKLNKVSNIEFVKSSWYMELQKNIKYKVIVSNPPYIDKADEHLTSLTAEPITALVADDKGMADIEYIVANAKTYLQKNGLLAIEHGYNQAELVQAIFTKYGFGKVTTIQDYGGNDRLTMGVLSI